MESVLVGVDRSEGSRRAVTFAMKRARVNMWRMTVAHVINWSRYSFPTPEANERRPLSRQEEIATAQAEIIDPLLDWIASQHDGREVEVTSVIRHGRPSEVLADLAEASSFDIIVVGRIGDSNLKTAIFGSTSNRLVQHAPVPVVVVP